MENEVTGPQAAVIGNGGIHSLSRGDAAIAYRRRSARQPGPGVVFLGGFRSDMTGTKAATLDDWAGRTGHGFVRFDYQGHGASSGDWQDATVGLWRDDALAVLDQLTDGPQILVGSSMGGWIALLAALARPEKVAGLLLIAAAPDFTERLIWDQLSPVLREGLVQSGSFIQPSAYDPDGYSITWRLISEGRSHLLLGRPIPFAGPVRLLHGQADRDVPWTLSMELSRDLTADNVQLTLIKDGDHRLSRPSDLALMLGVLEEMLAEAGPQP
jgi:pimeloyl-ACP methyl ester carboxylesterase